MGSLGHVATITREEAKLIPVKLVQTMNKALGLVGQTATGTYMVRTGTGMQSNLPGRGIGVNSTTLTWRSGALARSLTRPGDASNITEVRTDGQVLVGRLGSRLRYARIHELGGTIPAHQIPKTDKMRRFFFAMYYKTGEKMFLFAAVSSKNVINIPAITMRMRAYLNPAIHDEGTIAGVKELIGHDFKASLVESMTRALAVGGKTA